MFDDAEKKIARLIAESTTSGESKSGLGKIKVKGSGNIVALGDVTVTINVLPEKTRCKTSLSAQRADTACASPLIEAERIMKRCSDLGDPSLFLPFIRAVFGADRLEMLSSSEMVRLQNWLGLEISGRPFQSYDN